MKLAEITLENVFPFRNQRIGRLAEGVNIIEGSPGSGKTAIREFVRDILLGNPRYLESSNRSNFDAPKGQISIIQGAREYPLRRNWNELEQVQESIHPTGSIYELNAVEQYLGRLTPEVYEAVYSFNLKQAGEGLTRLAQVMNGHLGIPIGSAAAGDDDATTIRTRQLHGQRGRLNELRQQLDRLNLRRLECLRLLEQEDSSRQSRLSELDREIHSVSNQLNNEDLNFRRNQLASLRREIIELRTFIENNEGRGGTSQTTQIKPNLPDPYQLLYLRLDEIDSQIRRWRRVQDDVQSQRVRLKDEMVVWGELNLDSAEHPYHTARKVLVALEDRINQTDKQAKQWELSPTHHTDPSQSVRTIQALCQTMRQDLQLLSNELGQQYKSIRHRAAALELKQLRHCYSLIAESIERLVRRREQVIGEIRAVDSSGADAIMRSEASFMQCALHEGYFEARRRFIGPLTAMLEPVNQRVATDLVEARNRLKALQVEANQSQRWVIDSESRQSDLQTRNNQLLAERTRLSLVGRSLNSTELMHLEGEIQRLTSEYNGLAGLKDAGDIDILPEADPILAQAARSLHQLTGGEWSRVWLAYPATGGFVVSGRNDHTKSSHLLSPATQQLLYLALAFAAQRGFLARGIDLPTVIDDFSIEVWMERVPLVMEFLEDLQSNGVQLLLLTRQKYFGADTSKFARFLLPSETSGVGASQLTRQPLVEKRVKSQEDTAVTPKTGVDDYFVTRFSITTPDVLSQWIDSGDIDPTTLQPGNPLPTPAAGSNSCAANQLLNQAKPSNPCPAQSEPVSRFDSLHSQVSVGRSDYVVPYVQIANSPFRPVRKHPSFEVSAAPTTVDTIGDPLGFAPAFDDSTGLDRVDLLDPPRLRALSEVGIETIADLLELTPEELPTGLRERGISADQVDRWQAIVWMLSIVPGLRVEDAKILVACGVTEPEHLATSHPQQLLERIQRFVGSTEGQRFSSRLPSINLERINGWMRSLQASPEPWQQRNGFSRHSKRRQQVSQLRSATHGLSDRGERVQASPLRPELIKRETNHSHGNIVAAYPIRNDLRPERELHQPFEARPPRMQTPQPTGRPKNEFAPDRSRRVEREPVSIMRDRPPAELVPREAVFKQEQVALGDSKLRFYLDLKDHIEAAPSIGPKTAERFERIGVRTVEDFVRQTAESMAAKLKYQRITADLIRTWQNQARLVCRIPNLRGHDAQLLVACDLIEPEKIAAMQPQRLLDIILPFARSKEGMKIVRTGKEPDLQEVSAWIRWAAMTRSIHAA